MRKDADRKLELRDLEDVLGRGPEALTAFVSEAHPADLAEWLLELDEDDGWRTFQALDTEGGAEVLEYASDPLREFLLARIPTVRLVEYVELLPADEVVDILALAEDAATEEVLRKVDFERAQGLRELAGYEPDTAGGIMTKDFVAVSAGTRIGDAIKEIKSEEGPAGEEELGVFVVDEAGRPVGFMSDRDLLTSGIHTNIDEAMDTELVVARVDDDQEDVAHQVLKYSVGAVPVVDGAGRLVGVISADDVTDVLEEEAEEDIRRLVGTGTTGTEEQTRLPIWKRVRHRLPLMGLTVLGGVVTARILALALPGASESADVLRYLPIIIGLAGNVGIQSSTILVRAFATGEVQPEREASVVGAEVLTGLLIGVVCGIVTSVFATFLEADGDLGSAVGGAITVAVTWAAILGCLVPISCRRVGIDPAIVAGPFLITLSDISGAAIFVGVAHLMLEISA
ncbi:MAG: magnesium transporter [Planctomycetota bacterium]